MVKKISSCVLLACAAILIGVSPAYAQRTAPAFGRSSDVAPMTVNFLLGGFVPRGEDARVDGDVLVGNLDDVGLAFDVGDFKGVTVGGEWLIPFGNFIEAGVGLSFSRKTVPSVYAEFVDSDGTEIDQDLRLRIVPLSFTVRALPLGVESPVQPYFGAGLGVFFWRYSETGEFLDFAFDPPRVFTDNETYRDSGTQAGLVVLGGLRFAVDRWSVGGEIRYQKADADLDPNIDFAGTKIDLGGWTYQFTIGGRF
jgi:hypothetical protein